MATEFHGADLTVFFHSNPANTAVDHYSITYQCGTAAVVHRVDQADFQSQASDGTRSYQDTLTFAENTSAGLTRTPTVFLTTVLADGTLSTADTEYAQNSIPVLATAPTITPGFDGVSVKLATPSDADLAGYVAWVDTSATVTQDAAHERYRGASNSFNIPLADDQTYYLRVAPYDAFGLDLNSAWQAIAIKRGAAASTLANATAGLTTLNTQTIPTLNAAIGQAQSDIVTNKALAANNLAAAQSTLSAANAVAQTQANQARMDAAQVRTDLVPTITAAQAQANQARTDLACEVQRAQGAEGTISTTITNLTQSVGQNTSAITSEATQRTTADAALSSRIDSVTSTAGANTSAITNEASTRASADSSLAGQITTVSSNVAGNTAAITNEANTRASADSSLSSQITSLTTTVGNNTSAISNEATTRAAADSSISNTVSSLTASYNALQTNVMAMAFPKDFSQGYNQWSAGPGNGYTNVGFQDLSTRADWTQSSGNVFVWSQGGMGDGYVYFAPKLPANYVAQGYGYNDGTYLIAVNAGEVWRATAQTAMYGGGASVHNIYWNVFSKSGTPIYADSSPPFGKQDNYTITSDSTWHDVVCETTVPANGAYIRCTFVADGRQVAGSATGFGMIRMMRIDNVSSAQTINAQITNEATVRATADTSITNQVNSLTSIVGGNTAAIQNEATTRANADSSLSSQLITLTSAVGSNTSAISSEATARANADTSLSNQITTLGSTVGSNTSAITNEATTRAAADSALSTRTSSVESRTTNGNYVNTNPDFSSWPATQSYPNGWQNWGGDPATYTNASDPQRGGSNMFQITASATSHNVGFQTLNNVYCYPGWWVAEVRATLESGGWSAAGVLAPFLPNGGFNFASSPDTNGTVSATQVGQRSWSTIFNVLASNGVAYSQLYGMVQFGGFGGYVDKKIDFQFIGIRPATDAEIKAQTAFATTIPATIARIATEETTRSNADSALATQISSLTTAYQSADANLQSNINTEATTRSAADASLASRTSLIEASYGASPQSLINNSTFTSWPTANTLPSSWSYWSYANPANTTKVTGGFVQGQNAVRMIAPVNTSLGIYQTFYLSAGYIVLEASAWVSAGTWSGAGVYVDGGSVLNFAQDPDVNGTTGPGSPGIRRFSKIINNTVNGNNNIYAMSNWGNFGVSQDAKTIDFFYCNVRAATDAEIKAQVATVTTIPATIARIATEETTRASADSALATRIDSVTAVANNNTSAITTETNARATADSSLASQITTVTTNYENADSALSSTITNNYTALSNATTSLASRASSLEATTSNLTNSTLPALTARVSTNEGAIATANGKLAAYWQTTAVAGNNRAQLTIHADANGGAGVDIVGDFTVSGSAVINGTLNGSAVIANTMNASAISAGTITTDRLVDNSVTQWAILHSGTTFQGDSGSGTSSGGATTGSGGAGGSTGGGGTCPEHTTMVLLANYEGTGPGTWKAAGQLEVGDVLWTQHEQTMIWGAYSVVHARCFDALLYSMRRFHRATASHPFWLDGRWTLMEEIGQPSGRGTAVHITVFDAHTFVTKAKDGSMVLNHNKAVQP